MNRKLISKAISDIDDVFVEETIFYPAVNIDHPSERTNNMENTKFNSRRIIGLVLAACLVFAMSVTVYAADIGGIRRKIQIWRYGDQTTAILEIQDGNYTLSSDDGDLIMGGGGIAIEPDGSERQLTEEEIVEHLDQPDLQYKEDGTVWVFYHGEKIEITENMFDANGICYLELRDGDSILYATIERNGGMATSPNAYVQPWEFGTSD